MSILFLCDPGMNGPTLSHTSLRGRLYISYSIKICLVWDFAYPSGTSKPTIVVGIVELVLKILIWDLIIYLLSLVCTPI